MNETKYRKKLEDRISDMLPGCLILRNNAKEVQGIPDFTVFYGPNWAMLEVKISADAPVQPNQPYYIEWLGRMSFVSWIYPEIEDYVLGELIQYLEEGHSYNG